MLPCTCLAQDAARLADRLDLSQGGAAPGGAAQPTPPDGPAAHPSTPEPLKGSLAADVTGVSPVFYTPTKAGTGEQQPASDASNAFAQVGVLKVEERDGWGVIRI